MPPRLSNDGTRDGELRSRAQSDRRGDWLADWNEKEVQAAAKNLANKGHKTLAAQCDVSDDAQVEAMVQS